MKQKSLPFGDIVEMMNDDGAWGYYTKGFVDKKAFVAGLKSHFGAEGHQIKDVDHVHARLIPVTGRCYDLEFKVSKPGRGAFPCTFLEV